MSEHPRTALITGANKGIGYEIARQLAGLNYAVWIGARNADRGQAAAAKLREQGASVHFLHLDVTDAHSVTTAAATLAGHTPKLDVLINNAGIIVESAAPDVLDVKLMQQTYETNVYGPVRVTQAFLPLLKAAPSPRIVMMSSGLGSLTNQSNPTWPYYQANLLAYNSSKAALNAITVIFSKTLAGTKIKINAADPGYTATDINQNRGHRTVEQGAAIAVKLATLPDDGPTGGYFDDSGPVPW